MKNNYHLIVGIFVELTRRGIFEIENIASKLDDGTLEAQTDAQVRSFVDSGPVSCSYHAFGASRAETTRNQYAT